MSEAPGVMRFGSGPGETTFSQCIFCAHKSDEGAFCAAFPDGIPKVILTNGFDHRRPYPGDNGIRYEPRR
jgi:hypothetical protein